MKKTILKDINGKTVSKQQLMAALERNDGRIWKVVKELKLPTYTCLARYLRTNADIKELEMYFKQKLLAKAENILLDALDSENENLRLKAAMFVAETLGKQYYSKNPQLQITVQQTDAEKERQIQNIFGVKSDNVIDVDAEKQEITTNQEKLDSKSFEPATYDDTNLSGNF